MANAFVGNEKITIERTYLADPEELRDLWTTATTSHGPRKQARKSTR